VTDSNFIQIRGAKTHNLKNLDVNIPINSITCISGPSGSGKSSLAFHTLHTESKRRFMNSFPTDVKFFWDIPHTADVESISPVLPVWGLPQHNPVVGSRPAVIDHMGADELVQKLFLMAGENSCPIHKKPFKDNSSHDDLKKLIHETTDDENEVIHVFMDKRQFVNHFKSDQLPVRSFDIENELLNEFCPDNNFWEVFRTKFKQVSTIEKKLKENSLFLEGLKLLIYFEKSDQYFIYETSNTRSCPSCDIDELEEIDTISQLSAYSPLGACPSCAGHGMNLVYDKKKLVKDPNLSINEGAINILNTKRFSYAFPALCKVFKKHSLSLTRPFSELPEKKWDILFNGEASYPGFYEFFRYLESQRYKSTVRIYIRGLKSEVVCEECNQSRVKTSVHNLRIKTKSKSISYQEFLSLNISEALECCESIYNFFKGRKEVADIIKNLKTLIGSLYISHDLGLSYIPITKKVRTLSAGEYQRLLLVKYLNFNGSGSLFILDEPSLGLDIDEQKCLMKYLKKLKKQGNTILMVDHSGYLSEACDENIIMGPGAGNLGGEIVYQGKPKKNKSKKIKIDTYDLSKKIEILKVKSLQMEELPAVNIDFPINALTWIHGSSNAAKSKRVIEGLAPLLKNEINGWPDFKATAKKISKHDFSGGVHIFDTSLGRVNSRSTVGTIVGIMPNLRKYFSKLKVSKDLELKDGHFSPNSDLGRCQSCEGKGLKELDMQFLEAIKFVCEDCKGMKIKPFYATISDGNLSYNDVVNKPMKEVMPHIPLTPKMKRLWEYIKLLKLDYLSLGRSLTSLSGGEKQRLKLLAELQKSLENSLLIFENLSFGLSENEIVGLAEFLHKLLASNNTIVVIDQNPSFSQFSHYSLEFQIDKTLGKLL